MVVEADDVATEQINQFQQLLTQLDQRQISKDNKPTLTNINCSMFSTCHTTDLPHLMHLGHSIISNSLICEIRFNSNSHFNILLEYWNREDIKEEIIRNRAILRNWRDWSYWKFIMLNENPFISKNPHYFRKNVAVIHMNEQCQQVQQIYKQIKKEVVSIQQYPHLTTVARELFTKRPAKVLAIAFAFTVRQQMLTITTKDTDFEWDFQLDPCMMHAAYKLVQITDEYAYIMYSQSRNSTQSICNNL